MRLKAAAIACEPPSTSSASSAFTSIAVILLIATAGGLAIESRPALPATIRSAARHYHVPSLDSIPDPSAPFDLLADVNGTILTFASIIAAADTLAIEPSPIPLATSRPVAHYRHSSEPGSLPGPSVPLDLFADDSATHAIVTIAAADVVDDLANQPHLTPLTAFRPVVHHHRNLEPDSMPDLPAPFDAVAADLIADDSAILTIASVTAAGGMNETPPSRISRRLLPSDPSSTTTDTSNPTPRPTFPCSPIPSPTPTAPTSPSPESPLLPPVVKVVVTSRASVAARRLPPPPPPCPSPLAT